MKHIHFLVLKMIYCLIFHLLSSYKLKFIGKLHMEMF